MFKKISKKTIVILAIMLIGGLGGIIADRYVFPYLGSTDFFKKHDFLKRGSEDVTIINKTEQVFVKEETSIAKISNQASSSVVSIIAYIAADTKIIRKNSENLNVQYGTGLIVTSDGLIMTYLDAANLNDAKYKVVISDGSSYDAEFFGRDKYSNLSFLKISASNLAAVSFGNSDDIKSGEKVIAIGTAPSSFNHEYVAGLVSNFNATRNLAGKAISSSEKLEGVFEVDMTSGPDYVGGPVVDYMGQVIGVMGSSTTQNYFAIPSNKIAEIVGRAIKKELDQDPILGIYYVPLTKSYALVNGLSSDQGALIFSGSGQQGLAVIAGSPAQRAGLQLNDIITKINGQLISNTDPLSELVYQHKKGDTIELTILRAGQELKVSVQL